MPLIIKKLSVDTPSFQEPVNEDNDFIRDPDQIWDELPQPYRMINKILDNLLDAAWEEALDKENERILENSKVKPPKYDYSVQLQDFSNASCLADSRDGRYIFASFAGGLSILDASSMQTIRTYNEADLNISQMHVSLIGVQTYFLLTLSETGSVALYVSFLDRIFLIQKLTLAENTVATRCEAALDGNYMGVVLECLARGPDQTDAESRVSFEVYQLPREVWAKELEVVQKAVNAQANPDIQPGLKSQQSNLSVKEEKESDPEAKKEVDPEGPSAEPERVVSPANLEINFTPVNMVLKVRAPKTMKLQPNPFNSPSDCAKVVTDHRVIGTGNNHLMNKMYLELREAMFKQTHSDLLRNTPSELEQDTPDVTFHFVTPGVMTPVGVEVPGNQSKANHVMVWWSNANQVMFYCLNKPVKGKKGETEGGKYNRRCCPLIGTQSCSALSSVVVRYKDFSWMR